MNNGTAAQFTMTSYKAGYVVRRRGSPPESSVRIGSLCCIRSEKPCNRTPRRAQALCFTHTYNVMAPADCWSGWITADGSGQLNHGYFEGYTTIMPYSDPAAAARSGTLVAVDRESSLRRGRRRRLASSRLSVTFQRPLAPPSEFDYDITGRKTYLIWGVHATVPMCLDEATPGGACTSVGNYLQHDDGDYGAVIANLQCQGGERCILSEGLQIQAWEMVALGWFGGVAVLGLAGRVLRGRVQTCANGAAPLLPP